MTVVKVAVVVILVPAAVGGLLHGWAALQEALSGVSGDRRRQDPAPETATEDDEDDEAA